MPSAISYPPPWKHQSELALVRDWFYPSHVVVDIYTPSTAQEDANYNRIRAIDRVTVWNLKTAVPHPIMATVELIAAQLSCEHASTVDRNIDWTARSSTFVQDYNIRATYTTAFTRFVNGFVDKDAAGGAGESSMFANAAKIGMPKSFVDLRHRATHGKEMIGLFELKKATEDALEWIWDHWWKVNATGDPGRAIWEMQEWQKSVDEANRMWEETRQLANPHVDE